jgi:hypothetical protein
MAYSVVNRNKVMATNVDSLNATCVGGSNIENGWVFRLITISGSTGYNEVFYVGQPTAGSLNDLWMAVTPEVVVVQAADGTNYKGINQDPRNFINIAGSLIDAFKPQKGDIITLSADAFTGAKSTNTHANSAADAYDFVWGTTQIVDSLTLKWLSTDYFSIGSGSAIGGDQRATAYRMLVLNN